MNIINDELIDHYFSPGNIYTLYNFANSNNLDIKKTNLETFLKVIIKNKTIKFFILIFHFNLIYFVSASILLVIKLKQG